MKKRIISAILMILICLPFVLVGGKLFVVGIGVLSILAYKEILSIRGLESYPKPVVVLGLISMLLIVLSNTTAMFDVVGLNYKFLIASFTTSEVLYVLHLHQDLSLCYMPRLLQVLWLFHRPQ